MTPKIINKYDVFLQELFSSSEDIWFADKLKSVVAAQFDKEYPAARKILERAVKKGVMKSSSPMSFGKGMFAYYANEKKIYFNDLLEMSENRRPPVYRLLLAIKACGGLLSYYEALKVTSCQLTKSSNKNPLLDELIADINVFKLIIIREDKNKVRYIIANYLDDSQHEIMMGRHFSMMQVDTMFIYDVLAGLKRLNLIDNQIALYRNRKRPSLGAIHNNFVWDAFAYTNTSGLDVSSKGNGATKKVLLVMDVVVSRAYDSFDAQGFFERIRFLLNNTEKKRRIIPIIVFNSIDRATLNICKTLGMLTYDMGSFFGNRITEIIKDALAVKMSEHSIFATEKDPVEVISKSLNLIEETGNQINLSNVIGDFFQSLMYQLLVKLYPTSVIDQSVFLPSLHEAEHKDYEYDFVVISSVTKEVIIFEVKGYASKSYIKKGDYKTKNTLQWFFSNTFPSARKHYQVGYLRIYDVKACYITSAKFDNDGGKFLTDLNAGKLRPLTMDVAYDGKNLLTFLEQNSLTLLKKTIERYFVQK